VMRQAATFVFVSFAWIFFRAPDIGQALSYLQAMGQWSTPFSYNVIGGILLLLGFLIAQKWAEKQTAPWTDRLARLAWPVQFISLSALVWLCIELGPSGIPAFIYSRF